MAKRITDEDLRLNLIINGDGGRKEMLALDRQMKDLQSSTKRTRTELKNLEKAGKTGSQEHQNLTKTLKDQEKTLTECGKNITNSGMPFPLRTRLWPNSGTI